MSKQTIKIGIFSNEAPNKVMHEVKTTFEGSLTQIDLEKIGLLTYRAIEAVIQHTIGAEPETQPGLGCFGETNKGESFFVEVVTTPKEKKENADAVRKAVKIKGALRK